MSHYFANIKRKYSAVKRAPKKIILGMKAAERRTAIVLIIALIFTVTVAWGVYYYQIQGRKIKPAVVPAPPSVAGVSDVEIKGVNIVLDANPVKIEWGISKHMESRLLLFNVGAGSGQVFTSLYGSCKNHKVEIEMESNTDYSYEIEVISGGVVVASQKGAFRTSFFTSE